MDGMSLGFSALAIFSILAFTVLLAGFEGQAGGGEWAGLVLIAGTGAVVVALACSLQLLVQPLLLVGPLAALGALFATLTTSLWPSPSLLKRVSVAASATVLVFLPVASTVFGKPFDPFGTQLGVIDLGGALPTLVGGGCAAVGIALVQRTRTHLRRSHSTGWMSLIPVTLAWVASVGWMAGLELAADDMVPIIVVSALLMPPVAAATASLVERLRFRKTTAAGIASGLLAGIAAAVPACAFVTPPLAGVIGIAAGAISALLPERFRAWPAAMLALGGAVSAVLLGAFGTNIGFIYTGQPELVLGQAFITLVAILGGLLAGVVLGWVVRRWPSAQRSSRVG